jgi:SAM-dependent methyltransferase
MSLAVQSRDYWEESVDGYAAVAEPFTALFCADAVALAEITPGVTLLDVATGPGALALAAEEKGAIVTAIDFSQAMIDRLSERAVGRRIVARRMDGQALELSDASFDRACSVFGVPLFPDWRAGLAEMARVLRPGGIAVVAAASTPVGFGPNMVVAEARSVLFPGMPVTIGEGMTGLSDPERLRSALRDAGFASVEVHERTHDFDFDLAIFAEGNAMLNANPLLADLEPADRDRLVKLARSMAEEQRVGDRLRRECTALIAVARR